MHIGVIPSSTSNSKILLPYLSAYLSVWATRTVLVYICVTKTVSCYRKYHAAKTKREENTGL